MRRHRGAAPEADGDGAPRRLRGRRGTAIITASVLLFAFTAGGIIWLTRDVNRSVSNRSAAQSIAFQAARAGAQQIELTSLRTGESEIVEIDPVLAEQVGEQIGTELMDAYGVEGTVQITTAGDTVTASVTINDPAGDQSAVGTVQAQTGP